MASDRRIAANRRNAQMVQGPRSADGRARSAGRSGRAFLKGIAALPEGACKALAA